jgi:hypothetical protein
MNALITNYFEAEDAIVQRLREYVPELKDVLTPFGLADMLESSQASPVAHVVYAGDTLPNSETGNGSTRVVTQRWLIILAVRTPKAQLQKTTEIRAMAGAIVPKVLGCLQGWAPVSWMRPLGRASGGPPAGYSSSFAYFPFMFEGRIIT